MAFRDRCVYTRKFLLGESEKLLHTKFLHTEPFTHKFAQSNSQYYFVLQDLHKILPSTTLYYKACTKHFPVIILYYTACTKYFPVLLSTTKRAQSTSQYYFVLQSLHKTLPSTTLENQPLVVLRDHAMTHGSWWATLLSGRCRQNA